MDVNIGIKAAIKKSGMLQKAVAERAGFTEQQFSDMLYGRKVMRVEYLPRIANAIGVDIGDLFADTGQPSA